MLAFVPWPPFYELVPGETLGLFDLEPDATPNVWRPLGRDLARLHTFITPALLPPEEVSQCDDLRALRAGRPSAALLHGDSQTTNLMVRPGGK